MDLAARFARHVRDGGLLPVGARVLVACSGGADSTALAVLVARQCEALGLATVVLAHLDHGLREGSGADLRRVATLATSLGLPFVGERRDVDRRPGESPEEAARRVRYAFLLDAADAHAATDLLTAHHMDDQAETVLLRTLRGTGPDGLAGIRPERSLRPGLRLVRPLLPFRRDDLRRWLEAQGIAWSEDPTNESGNERARLRRSGLPTLAECVGRDPVPLLARLAENVHDQRTPVGAPSWTPFARAVDGHVRLYTGFERLPRATRTHCLRALLPGLRGGAPLTRAEAERAVDGVADGGEGTISGIALVRHANGWTFGPSVAARQATPTTSVAVPGSTELWDGVRLSVRVQDTAAEPFLARLGCRDGTLEIVDADRLCGPLVARTRREGDRIRPLGAETDARLGHVLQRRGIAAAARDRVPLLCDTEGIVWVAGVCLSDRVRVCAESRRLATLQIVRATRD